MVCMKDLTGCQMSWRNRNDKIGTTIIAMVLLYLIIRRVKNLGLYIYCIAVDNNRICF